MTGACPAGDAPCRPWCGGASSNSAAAAAHGAWHMRRGGCTRRFPPKAAFQAAVPRQDLPVHPPTHTLPPPTHTHTTPPTRTCSPLVPPPYTQETDHGFQPCTHLEHANYLGRCAGPWSRRLALVAHVVILFDLLFRSLDTAQASAPLPPFPPCRELQRAEFALLAGAAYVQD